jgi:hypothetical protein
MKTQIIQTAQGIIVKIDHDLINFDRATCDCGNPNAGWHGDRCGHRYYACADCAHLVETTHGVEK